MFDSFPCKTQTTVLFPSLLEVHCHTPNKKNENFHTNKHKDKKNQQKCKEKRHSIPFLSSWGVKNSFIGDFTRV